MATWTGQAGMRVAPGVWFACSEETMGDQRVEITADDLDRVGALDARLHRERASRQALLQAEAQYRSAVITAFQNVADTLHALVSDATALKTAVDAERAAKVALDLATKQQQVGYVNYLAVLVAVQAYQQAVAARVQAQATHFGGTAALCQALGGGWWHREDDNAKSAGSNAEPLRIAGK